MYIAPALVIAADVRAQASVISMASRVPSEHAGQHQHGCDQGDEIPSHVFVLSRWSSDPMSWRRARNPNGHSTTTVPVSSTT
jgi:hypothetical protein